LSVVAFDGKDAIFQHSKGLDFILGHFEEPIWPRKISCKCTGDGQILAHNRDEALAWFKLAKFLDCKISAYPFYQEWKGINRQAPSLMFIDQDSDSITLLRRTLKHIDQKLAGPYPTVIWSGHGYHIYLPVKAFILEQESIFSEFEQPSRKFIQFAEQFLSRKKSDPCHSYTMSFKNCMLRVPFSYNSKSEPAQKVKIIQQWSGVRPSINWLLRDFRRYLIQDRYDRSQRHYHPPHEACKYIGPLTWRKIPSIPSIASIGDLD